MPYLPIGGNQRLFYKLISGNPDRPHLIFLHEGLGCTAMWKDVPKRLCRRTGCAGLVYDRSGYGQSSGLSVTRTVHYLHDYALNELPHVIAAVIPDRPYVLVGHSDGGSIAMIHGAEKPPLLRGIISESAHVFVDGKTLDGIRKTDAAYAAGKLNKLAKYHGEKTNGVFRAWSDTWLSPWFRHWSIVYALPSIDAPLLVIQGCDDPYGTLEQVHSILTNSNGPADSIMIEDCGHTPHLEQTGRVLEHMAAFIGDRRPYSAGDKDG